MLDEGRDGLVLLIKYVGRERERGGGLLLGPYVPTARWFYVQIMVGGGLKAKRAFINMKR